MSKYLILFICPLLTFITACKTDKATSEDKSKKEAKVENKYTLSPFSPSPEFLDAKITSTNYKDGAFDFGVEGENYKLGEQTSDAPQKMCANSGKGQHIHLIVDNKPYAAKYTNTFDYEIEDGKHHLLAFLSRSYHESIKTKDAHVAKLVDIKDNSIVSEEDITTPMLFYSRPKGTYVGEDTKKVMLDFYLSNTDLGKNKVEADINGEKHLLDKWQPYYIEGLPMGENTIKLTLLDGQGNKVSTDLNPVTRTFTLKADPTPEK